MFSFSHQTPYMQEVYLQGGPLDGHTKRVKITDDQEQFTFMESTYRLTGGRRGGLKVYKYEVEDNSS